VITVVLAAGDDLLGFSNAGLGQVIENKFTNDTIRSRQQLRTAILNV
jgi:hypothetical protein